MFVCITNLALKQFFLANDVFSNLFSYSFLPQNRILRFILLFIHLLSTNFRFWALFGQVFFIRELAAHSHLLVYITIFVKKIVWCSNPEISVWGQSYFTRLLTLYLFPICLAAPSIDSVTPLLILRLSKSIDRISATCCDILGLRQAHPYPFLCCFVPSFDFIVIATDPESALFISSQGLRSLLTHAFPTVLKLYILTHKVELVQFEDCSVPSNRDSFRFPS